MGLDLTNSESWSKLYTLHIAINKRVETQNHDSVHPNDARPTAAPHASSPAFLFLTDPWKSTFKNRTWECKKKRDPRRWVHCGSATGRCSPSRRENNFFQLRWSSRFDTTNSNRKYTILTCFIMFSTIKVKWNPRGTFSRDTFRKSAPANWIISAHYYNALLTICTVRATIRCTFIDYLVSTHTQLYNMYIVDIINESFFN